MVNSLLNNSLASTDTNQTDRIELDNFTLMMALQAVNSKIKRYEQLLVSNQLSDKAEILSLLNSYKKAARQLQGAYLKTSSAPIKQAEQLSMGQLTLNKVAS